MVYRVEEIMRAVRVCLDQNMVSESLALEGDVDTLSVDEIIRSKIEEGVRRVHSTAPLDKLESGHNFGDAVYWGERGSGWVLLPDDFMRLIAFEMSDWERPVHTVINAESVEYKRCRSRIKALGGTPQRPLCAIVRRPEGLALEFYSCKDDMAWVTRGLYVPYPRIDEDGGIDISERCYESVVYTIAALVLVTLSEAERAVRMFEMAGIAQAKPAPTVG